MPHNNDVPALVSIVEPSVDTYRRSPGFAMFAGSVALAIWPRRPKEPEAEDRARPQNVVFPDEGSLAVTGAERGHDGTLCAASLPKELAMPNESRPTERSGLGYTAGRVETDEGNLESPKSGRRMSAEFGTAEPVPLAGYAAFAGLAGAGLGAFLIAARDRLPRHVAAGDFALLALATHALARIVAKDRVTRPLRAAFVRFQDSNGEVDEKPRGRGLRRVAGELVTSRGSLAPWIAGALGAGFVLAPRVARFVATVFGAVAIADAVNAGTKRLTN
jgi:hypothetical protein